MEKAAHGETRDDRNPRLLERDALPDPIAQFRRWFDEARASGAEEPHAAALASLGDSGEVHARMVLVRGFDERGFAFYTNYESVKGRDLDGDPHAALLFHWPGLDRQVRIEGTARRLSASESDAYFAQRPRGHQLSAWASPQSRPLESREALERRVAEAAARFGDGPVPRPPHWGGYRLTPARVEFWQGGPTACTTACSIGATAANGTSNGSPRDNGLRWSLRKATLWWDHRRWSHHRVELLVRQPVVGPMKLVPEQLRGHTVHWTVDRSLGPTASVPPQGGCHLCNSWWDYLKMAPQKSKFVFYLLACCALAVVLCAEGADASLLRRHSRLPAASPPPSCAFAVRVVDLKPSPPVAHEPVTVVLAFTSVADAITNCFIGAEIDGVVQPWSDTLLGFPPGATYTRIMNFQAPAPGAHDLVLFARAGPAKGGSATDIFWQELKVSPRP